MPINAAIVVAGVIIITTVMALIVFAASRKRQAKEDELKRASSARGWQFESVSERGYRVHRWTGTTESVPWRAESLRFQGNSKQRRPHLARWHADFSLGIHGAILIMGLPKGKEDLGQTIAAGEGFFAKLAQKAVGFALDKAVDTYFGDGPGKDVDAAALHRVDGGKIPGFVVMAADKDEGARVLAQGLERTLLDASNDRASIFGSDDRPWILLRPKVISLARTAPFGDLSDVDGFTRAGLTLTRSSKFARPFA